MVAVRRTFVLFTLLVTISALCNAEEWRKTYPVSGKPEIRVDANDAEILVHTSDRKDIEAVVTTQGYKIGSGGVTVSEQQSGDRLDLTLRTPNFHFFSFGLHKSVRVELDIPRTADLNLHSGDGNITADHIEGTAVISSGDGNIRIDEGKGRFDIETGDGRVEGHSLEGELKADTKDGPVHIDGVFTRLDLQTGDGSIDAEAHAGSKMSSEWRVKTGDGSVTMAVPDGFAAVLDARTGDGHISIDFPVTVNGSLHQNQIHGTLNGGGPVLEIKTGDGNITLRRS